MTDSAAAAPAPALSRTLREQLRAARGRLVIWSIIVVAALLALLIAGQSAQQRPALDPTSTEPSGAKALLSVLRDHGIDVRTASTLVEADRQVSGVSPDELTIALYDPNGYLPAAKLAADDRLDARTVLIAPASGVADTLRAAGRDVAVITTESVLENQHIAESDNAAQAIRLLGRTRVLLWYTPSLADASTTAPQTVADVTPPWVTPLVVLAALVAAAAAIWRGRRFGPLVVEDLPVVVRASESLEGRARLYQRSDARLHALDALRMGAVRRVAKALGLGPGAEVSEVCAAVAERLRLDPAAVRRVLLDGVPRGDAELMELARRVRSLEESVTPVDSPDERNHQGEKAAP